MRPVLKQLSFTIMTRVSCCAESLMGNSENGAISFKFERIFKRDKESKWESSDYFGVDDIPKLKAVIAELEADFNPVEVEVVDAE